MSFVLRRSVSTPCVRPAPYTYPIAPPASSSGRRRHRGTSDATPGSTTPSSTTPRRERSDLTSPRRVLAEIEWWRVMQGQEQETDDNEGDADALPVSESTNGLVQTNINNMESANLYPLYETLDYQQQPYVSSNRLLPSAYSSRTPHSRTSSSSSDASSDDFPLPVDVLPIIFDSSSNDNGEFLSRNSIISSDSQFQGAFTDTCLSAFLEEEIPNEYHID